MEVKYITMCRSINFYIIHFLIKLINNPLVFLKQLIDSCRRVFLQLSAIWQSYHPGEVLKRQCSVNKNHIFGFSVVSYPRPRWNFERGPPIVSKKKFDKIQWENNVTEQKKINRFAQDSNLSRVISTLLSPSTICELFLFCSVPHVIIILLFNLLMSGYSNSIPSAVIIR